MYGKINDNRIRTPEEVEDINGYLDGSVEFCERTVSSMEKASVSALRAVVEGNRGVYEHET